MFVLPMAMASHHAQAQEVTITLNPGWTWVSYPRADTLDVTTALQSIPPTEGDVIKSQTFFATYMNGMWLGNLQQLIPGKGLMYKSMNTETVSFVFGAEGGESHEYVDLGLPSGLLWATCNVGATAPEEYGDYFAWGETQPRDTYNWSTYQYCDGSSNTLTKYCNNSSYGYNGYTDTLTVLLPEDDAATANWGSNWRMPTQAEWQELYQNTTHTWTTQNGVKGRLFTAANGNRIFLPAAGSRSNANLYLVGNLGYYWSSSLNANGPHCARHFYISSGGYGMYESNRYEGHSVRAVREN